MNWIDLFRVGTWTDSSGRTLKFTAEDLDRIVAGYDPAKREAPLVFGHPKGDEPAFGWVSKLRRVGDVLQAVFRDVPDAVKQLVAEGRYKKRSISLYSDGMLRHVGLLGAAAPAVSGLRDIKAFEADEEATFYEFEEADMDLEEAKRKLAEAEAENARLKAGGEFKALEAKAADLGDQLKAAVESKDKTEKEFSEHKAEQAMQARETRVDALIEASKLLPAERDNTLAFAEALGADTGEMEFSAGEGKSKEKVSKEEAYWRGLENKNPHGLFNEFKAPGGEAKDQPSTGNLAGKF